MRASFLTAVLLLAGLAGCGSGGGGDGKPSRVEDEKAVRAAADAFGAAARSRDTKRMCDLIGPRTRERLARLAAAAPGPQTCVSLLEQSLVARPYSAPKLLTGATGERIDRVRVRGARARASGAGSSLPLRRDGKRWRIELIDLPRVAYAYDASIACSEVERRNAVTALPAATKAGIVAALRRDGLRFRRLRAALAKLRPPRALRARHRAMLRDLAEYGGTAARTAKRADAGELDPLLRRATTKLNRLTNSINRRARRSGVACLGEEVLSPEAGRFYADAEALCRPARQKLRGLPRPTTRSATIAYYRRLASIEEETLRQLRGLEPPPSYRRLYRATLERASDSTEALRDAAVNGERGGTAAAQLERGYLTDISADYGFQRVGVPACSM
jgi:hypothetical protein